MASTVHEFDPDQVHDEIATLRGMVDKLNEVIGTSTGLPIQVTDPLAATDPVNGGPEDWHTLGTLSNFAISAARFRMTTMGNVEFDIGVNGNGSNVLTTAFSVTIPAAYRPVSVIRRARLSAVNRAVTAGDQDPTLVVNTTGVVQILAQAGITSGLQWNGSFPMDL